MICLYGKFIRIGMHKVLMFKIFRNGKVIYNASTNAAAFPGVRRRNSMWSALLIFQGLCMSEKDRAVTLSRALPGQAEAPDVKCKRQTKV